MSTYTEVANSDPGSTGYRVYLASEGSQTNSTVGTFEQESSLIFLSLTIGAKYSIEWSCELASEVLWSSN